MNHDAIYRSHSNVVRIDDATGAFDADGNQVTIDQSLVDAAAAEISTEKAWSRLRYDRNQLLTATDWEIVRHKELGTNIPTALKTYRQELRDLPANTSDPANPSWPVKP
ncbi:MAG: hypothetical protein DWQ49_02075 [Bacteroidetes bacterium]|nr:MAG: hypothetical protein DWQ49_02075 [Bacteroidota bacterium]